ncbi:hypothetical protein GCM10007938_18590 [Vibrio zhanjiangensis]|uniref:YokE-like PH domain-containing protein n=1 Tax=Vibrio zhanjiangensis TaxID=1046128 RepID=A0ABQ6EYH2_9VIBR|nr:hypothetical protein [Vibrio zhanjiangensis]GLT18081.1 hypothetical protein GCM10007938_18590 [Vibrio zhanjiangensis]
MKIEQVQAHIEEHINDGDSLVGFFQAMSMPSYWLILLFGPLIFCGLKVYFLAITEKGISFHKLSFWGKFKEHDFFEFNEIESVDIGKGFLQRPMTFKFKNTRKIKLKAQLKGAKNVARLQPAVQEHIEKSIIK